MASVSADAVERALTAWQRVPVWMEEFRDRVPGFEIYDESRHWVKYVDPWGNEWRHRFLRAESEFLANIAPGHGTASGDVAVSGNPWGLTSDAVLAAADKHLNPPAGKVAGRPLETGIISKLGLGELLLTGSLSRNSPALGDEDSCERYGKIAALVTLLKLVVTLDAPVGPALCKKVTAPATGTLRAEKQKGGGLWWLLDDFGLNCAPLLWFDLMHCCRAKLGRVAAGLGRRPRPAT